MNDIRWKPSVIGQATVTVLALALLSATATPVFAQPIAPESPDSVTNPPAAELNAVDAAADNAADAATHAERAVKREGDQSVYRDVVVFGRSVELNADQTAQDVVVIGGSANVRGKARDSVVTILGSANLDGETKDAVAVMGSVKLGTNAHVRGDAVAVMGNVKLARGAKVKGDVVAVGGSVEREEGAVIDGDVFSLPGVAWLGDWVEQCVYKLRPLSPRLGWLWVIAGAFLVLYAFAAVAFPRPISACREQIASRPATTLMVGLVTKMLVPIITFILLATGIGVFVVPFLFAVLVFAGIVGKVALLQHVGGKLGRFGGAALQSPLMALLLGWILLTLLYLVPILGLVVYGLAGVWALGAAVMAMFGSTRREMPQRPAAPPAPTPIGLATAAAATPAGASGLDSTSPTDSARPETSPLTNAVPDNSTTPVAETLSLPRANFWERMGAAFLDVVLVGILSGLVGGPPLGFLVALAYFAGMWTWKGTTIGGIVLNLKVVRLDGGPLTFTAALVRGLAAAFSVIVLFLGFLWIIWDKEKQGWHDQIAGTVVIRIPRGTPLVCI